MFVDCRRRTLPNNSERGANNSGPNAEFRTSGMSFADVIYFVPYARTNTETVNTTSTELLI